jgi:hypothetical protein
VASQFSSPRTRALLGALAGVLAAPVLAACSSSGGATELTTAPSVTANGEHYAYAPGSVAKSAWPKVCSLLTADSAAAAVGTGVTAKTFHARCYYIPGNDTFPTLTVTILGIGNDQRQAFDAVRDQNARFSPTRVGRVGDAAVLYTLRGSPTVNLDVLADQGLFEISLRSPVGLQISQGEARSILTKVGRVLAKEFTG